MGLELMVARTQVAGVVAIRTATVVPGDRVIDLAGAGRSTASGMAAGGIPDGVGNPVGRASAVEQVAS
jgi:hypothetical protein